MKYQTLAKLQTKITKRGQHKKHQLANRTAVWADPKAVRGFCQLEVRCPPASVSQDFNIDCVGLPPTTFL